MQSPQSQIVTLTAFLRELSTRKPRPGNIHLEAHHWFVEGSRGVIAAGSAQNNLVAESQKPDGPSRRVDGVLRLGEMVEFHGRSPIGGYLHLFNLGTSGGVYKLGPSVEYPSNRIESGEAFVLPSDRLFQSGTGGPWQVQPPLSALHNLPERVLAIVTVDDTDIQIGDLYPNLRGRDVHTRCASRGPGFSGPARVDVAKLFRIPPGRWEYGLIELDVAE